MSNTSAAAAPAVPGTSPVSNSLPAQTQPQPPEPPQQPQPTQNETAAPPQTPAQDPANVDPASSSPPAVGGHPSRMDHFMAVAGDDGIVSPANLRYNA